MSNKFSKVGELLTLSTITLGSYVAVLPSDKPWTVGLAAFVVLLAGARDISNVLFDDIDLEKLKRQIEASSENARLFWSIIDAGIREAAIEKIRLYNLYLKGALENTSEAKNNNSKVLLVIQQMTLEELRLFELIYENYKYLAISAQFSMVNNSEYMKTQFYDSVDLDQWVTDHMKDGMNDIKLVQQITNRYITVQNIRKFKPFEKILIQNEVDMLSHYGLLDAGYGAMGGTTYNKTEFGKYLFDIIRTQRNTIDC